MTVKTICHCIGTMATGGGSKNVNALAQLPSVSSHVIDVAATRSLRQRFANLRLLCASDIIHTHGPKALVAFCLWLVLLRLLGKTVIFSPHGFDPSKRETSFRKRLIKICTLFAARSTGAKIVCVSNAERARLAGFFSNEKLHLIYNGIDVPEPQLHFNNKSKYQPLKFLLVGRFDPVKHYRRLCEIAKEYSQYTFGVAGDGPQFDEIQNLASVEGISNIDFLGLVPEHDLPFADYDYFLSLSLSEGLPYSVLEALAHALWPILSDIEPHKEIIEVSGIGSIIGSGQGALEHALSHLPPGPCEFAFPVAFSIENMKIHYASLYQEN